MEKLNGTKVDAEIEAEPQTQENVPRMLVAGDARVADRTQKDSINVLAQVLECFIGKGLLGLEVVIGGIGEAFPSHSELVLRSRAIDNGNGCLDDLRPNPVAGYDGDLVRPHKPPNRLTVQPPKTAQPLFIQSPSLSHTPGSTPSRHPDRRRSPDT